ncbi:hypothetical protein V1264_017463 [Littorina saxatilis]|uniref:Ig-like domain-containing protein n=2 Tax=Littorina saxatilis TaxID=31220 RepID=A0AAN9BJ84_9CAEN
MTCYFNSDVKGNKNSINVAMTWSSADGNKKERDVLQCSWMQNADKPDCLVTPGYTFNYDITDRLTVEIPSTTAAFAGTYSCHIVPPNGATTQSCELVVKEKPATFSNRNVESSPLGTPAEYTDSQQGILTAILVLLILLIILVISAALYYAWKKKWLPSSIPFRTTPNNNVEENAEHEPLMTATTDTGTQTERAGRQDVGTDCPTDIPLAVPPQEKPVSTHVLMSGESGLESQTASAEDKPTKKKHSGKFSFGSRKSKEKKSKEEEQK